MQLTDLSALTNESLLLRLKDLIHQERKILTQILEMLREVDRRRSYLPMGYPSLFEFCVEYLGYGEAATYRRIQAMRLLVEIPDLKSKITEGKLNITHLSQAQTFFKTESRKNNKNYSVKEKAEIVSRLEGKSKIESEKELIKISPNFTVIPKESVTFIAKDKIKLNMTIDQDLFDKLKRLKNIFSHKNPNMTYAEVVTEIADRALKSTDLSKRNATGGITAKNVQTNSDQTFKQNGGAGRNLISPEIEKEILMLRMGIPRSRYIPAAVKNEVWNRYKGRCSFQDLESGRICGSEHQVQVDHIQPFSEGGLSSDPRNLRLLCANHNRGRNLDGSQDQMQDACRRVSSPEKFGHRGDSCEQ